MLDAAAPKRSANATVPACYAHVLACATRMKAKAAPVKKERDWLMRLEVQMIELGRNLNLLRDELYSATEPNA